MDFTGLQNVLEEFDSHSRKGAFRSGDWEIANGGYDLWFEISYLDEVLVKCVDGELSFKNRLNGSVMKELSDVITGVYDHLRVDLADRRKMLEGSFEVGQEFFEKSTGRYFTLAGEGGRSFNIWNIDVFNSDKEFQYRTSVHAGRLANDILAGDIVSAEGIMWKPVYSKIANEIDLVGYDDYDSVPGYGSFPTLAEILRDYQGLMDIVKDVRTIEQAKAVQAAHGLRVEINGEPIDEFENGTKTILGRVDNKGTDQDIEWIRYENFGCLSYVYDRFDGHPTFDVWSNAMHREFIETVTMADLTEKYFEERIAEEVEHLVERGEASREQVDNLIASVTENGLRSDLLDDVIKTCENMRKDKDMDVVVRDMGER